MTQATPSAPAKQDNSLEKIQNQYMELLGSFQTIQLATASVDGVPFASYAPAVMDDKLNFYVYLSEIALHTDNLLKTGKASFMIIEDESLAAQIFARKRATYQASASEIARGSAEWEDIIGRFEEKFGRVVEHLKTMDDFHLIRLTPTDGRLVVGFARAYTMSSEDWSKLEHLKGIEGSGHRTAPAGHQSSGEVSPITQDAVERICGHMNEDHGDSVLMYVHHYGKRTDATSAVLTGIDNQGMDIEAEFPSGKESVRITFEKPLNNAKDAHLVLVDMSKAARKALHG